jgi:predicted unusual protein kinase regulating ubiquinone biosynthesis (AarF/ABC1/UbiB family)
MAAGGLAEKTKRLRERAEQELPHVLLTVDNARLLAERLARLRGAAMKVGQMLSMEGDSMLPKEFAKALEVLRSSAHTMPEDQVRQVLADQYGAGWADLFQTFELTPMASASIGQVHRAVARDGRQLVVKLQYPGVAESIDSDVDNLRSLLRLARLVPGDLDLDALSDEVKSELRKEVDYERELASLCAYRERLGSQAGFRLPAPHADLSRSRALALDLAPGVPLLDWAADAPRALRDDLGRRLLELLTRELFAMGLMQTDPNPANYLYHAAGDELVLLDFGATREVPPEVAELYRMAFRGIATRDSAALYEVLERLGIGGGNGAQEASDLLVRIALEASEVLGANGYDFAASDLPDRLQSLGRELSRFRTQLRPPPPAYLFFQRKLGGTFLLCRQLGARVDCRAVLEAAGVL